MGASTIFFNGRVISESGSYSTVDASGLEQVGLGAAGIVAVLGTAVGGTPAASLPEAADFLRVKKPEKGRELFRSGDLREVMDMLFAPGKDPDILGGAQEVIAMKTNPATRSTAVLPNVTGNCMDLASVDYGEFTTQINISIATGTTKGKLITIIFEDDTIAGDDIGADIFFNLKYVDSGDGWTTATAQVKGSGDVEVLGTRTALAGKDGDITPLAAQGTVDVVGGDVGDVGQVVTVFGLDAAGLVVSESFTLTGTTPVVGTQVFGLGDVFGAVISGAATLGATIIRDTVIPSTIMTITLGLNQSKGLHDCVAMYAASVIGTTVSGASTKDVILSGLSATGAAQLEKITLTGDAGVPPGASGALVFSEIQHIIMGDVEAAQTVVYSGTIAKSLVTVQDTLQKVADYFNARAVTPVATTYGFIFTLVTGLTAFDPGDLDIQTAVTNILSPLDPAFYADLWACINWVNTSGQYMTAAMTTGAKDGAPSNTAAPIFLSGGIEGVATSATYLAALNLLKKTRVNSIVLLTADAAMHANGDAHCVYMSGAGRSERDLFVGLMGSGASPFTVLSTKAEIKTQIVALNSRHTRAFAQAIERYNTAGNREEFNPHFQAAVVAGMQAGSPVGTPLTHKYANVLKLRQSVGATGWNPTDDSEDMIQAGLCFMESVEGVGRRIKRNITTHLTTSNLAYTEGSVNEAVNYAVYNFRTNLEWAVGRKGFSGKVNATKAIATNTLGLLVGEEVLVVFRSLDIELIVDVMEVSVEIAPVLPINFVKSTVHLVTIPQVAA